MEITVLSQKDYQEGGIFLVPAEMYLGYAEEFLAGGQRRVYKKN